MVLSLPLLVLFINQKASHLVQGNWLSYTRPYSFASPDHSGFAFNSKYENILYPRFYTCKDFLRATYVHISVCIGIRKAKKCKFY